MLDLGAFAGAEALGRAPPVKHRRILDPGHYQTLITPANLAVSLSQQGKHTEAVEILRDV